MKTGLPYNVMRHRDWDVAPRDPVSIATFIAPAIMAGGAFGSVGAFLLTTAVYVGVTAVTSWAISALTPKPDFGALTSSGILVNQRDGIAPFDFVYGEVRKGGIVSYFETTGEENTFLHQIIVLAGHEVDSIGDIYINDEVVTLDGDGFVTSNSWDSKIRINKNLGSPDQLADADLLAESAQVSSDFRGRGRAYLYVRYEYDQDVFANGLPLVTAVVRGKKVYDPRTDTTAWSDNAALCIRDYIKSSYGLNDSNIDDIDFAAAANICDEQVNLSGGGTESRYTINGIAKANTTKRVNLQNMMTACGGTLFWGAGKFKLKVADYVAPTKVLTLSDIRGPIDLSTRTPLQDQYNGVQGTFSNVADRWVTVDYPPIKSDVFVAEDGGEESLLDLPLPYTTSSATAQRLAKLTLYRAREQMTLKADFGLNAFDVEVGEIVAFTNERYGWVEKEFEVTEWVFGAGEAGDLRVTLTLRETSEAAFDWDAEETDIISNNTNLLSPLDVPTPTLDAAAVSTVVNTDGTAVPEIKFSWSVTDASYVDYFDFQYKLSTESEYNSIVVKEAGSFVLSPAISGASYDYRVRSVNVFGVRSAFASSVSPAVTGDDGTTPNAPSNLLAIAGSESIKLVWDAPTQNTDSSTLKDLFQHRIYRNEANDFATASLIGRISGDIFTDGSLVGGTTYYYWVTAVDYTGNESAQSAVSFATANSIEVPRTRGVFYIGVTTLPTTSSGANTDFVASTGEDPVDGDQAWFYTGTLANPTAQSVWIYDADASLWNEQEEVIDGDLVVSGTVTADKIAANAIETDKIAAGSVTSVKIADSIQSDNYSAGSSGWKIDRDFGDAEFNNVTVRGLLSATLIDASEQFAFDCGGGRIAPIGINQNKSVEGTSVAPVQLNNSLISPDYSTGYSDYRLARYNSEILLEALGEMNGFGGSIILQVSVDGGTWTDIASRTIYNNTGYISYTYTTPGSFDTLAFRVTENSGASMRLGSISLTASNW